MFSEFKIEISEFIFGVSLINSKTENTEVYSILNISLIIFLIKTVHFNRDKIP